VGQEWSARALAHMLQLFSVVALVDFPAAAIFKQMRQKIRISTGNFGAPIAPWAP